MNFRTLNYITWELLTLNYTTHELLNHKLHHTWTSGSSITPHGNFWTLNYTTWELLDPQLHHMETSGPSIALHGNLWTLNYTTQELMDPQLDHTGTCGPSIRHIRDIFCTDFYWFAYFLQYGSIFLYGFTQTMFKVVHVITLVLWPAREEILLSWNTTIYCPFHDRVVNKSTYKMWL